MKWEVVCLPNASMYPIITVVQQQKAFSCKYAIVAKKRLYAHTHTHTQKPTNERDECYN